MREAESCRSAARLRAVSEAATQRSAAPVAGPASSATSASHGSSTPATASGSDRRQGSGIPRSSRRSSIASSSSAASSPSSVVRFLARTIASCCRATSRSASSRSTPASTNSPSVALMTSSASAMSEAARLTAAAGLLSSCARPAAIVPNDSRRSRFCSAPASRDITGFICPMTRSCTAGCAKARRRKSSAGMSATSHGTMADIRTASGPRVRTAMAPTHVGATWRPTGSVRPSLTITVCASPSSRQERPSTSTPCSASNSPGSKCWRCATAAHSANWASSRSSKRSTGRRSAAEIPAVVLIPAPGTRG